MVRDIVGVATAIVIVAGLTAAVVNGRQTAAVIGAIGDAFSGSIRAATMQG